MACRERIVELMATEPQFNRTGDDRPVARVVGSSPIPRAKSRDD